MDLDDLYDLNAGLNKLIWSSFYTAIWKSCQATEDEAKEQWKRFNEAGPVRYLLNNRGGRYDALVIELFRLATEKP